MFCSSTVLGILNISLQVILYRMKDQEIRVNFQARTGIFHHSIYAGYEAYSVSYPMRKGWLLPFK
jgi:hypothetical protein